MIEYVLGFAFSDDDHVALIKKNRPEWQAGKFNGVGGHMEQYEFPLGAMRREFKEETGLTVNNWEKFGVLHGDDWAVHLFRAHNVMLGGYVSATDEEVVVVKVSDLNYVACIDNLRWLVPFAHNKINYRVKLYLGQEPE